MRKTASRLLLIALLIAAPAALFAQNYTAVTGSKTQDNSGNLLPAGQVCAYATDQYDNPISFVAGGGGPIGKRSTCATITNGVVSSYQLANLALASPSTGVYYHFQIRDTSNGQIIVDQPKVYVSGSSFSIDTGLVPAVTVPLTPANSIIYGSGAPTGTGTTSTIYVRTDTGNTLYCAPAGTWQPCGGSGSGLTLAGTYSSGTTYIAGSVVTYNGIVYYSNISSNVGNTPSSSPSAWTAFADAPGQAAAAIPLTQKGAASGVASLDSSSLVPANQSRVASVNGKTGTVAITGFDTGVIAGPGAGSSRYYTNTEAGGSTIDTVQGYLTYWIPSASTNLQVSFGNVSGINEATCGPQMTLRAAIEYPIDSTPKPIFFNGQRDVTISPCGSATSDPLSMDTTSSSQLIQVRWKAARINGDTTAFPANWQFNQIAGSSVLSPYTTTKAGGRWDGNEELKTRTVTDGTTTAASTTFTSATAAFVAQDAGQSISIAGAGASGATLNTTIASYTNATTVTLAVAASTAVAGTASTTITPADKTTSGTIYNVSNASNPGFAPVVLLAKQSGLTKSISFFGDSICWGQGSSNVYGGWCAQSVDGPGVAAGLATNIHSTIPYVNMSMPGEFLYNLAAGSGHAYRASNLGRTKYTHVPLGTNDLGAGQTAAQIEGNFITICNNMRVRGTFPILETIIPRTTNTALSTVNSPMLTLASQTTQSSESVRVAVNTWLRDGAPVDNTSGLPVAAGTSSSSSTRAAYYTGGTLTTAASGTGTNSTGGSINPVYAILEMADIVESSRNSGLWAVDPNVRTLTGCSITAASQTLTCSSGTFTSADVNAYIIIPGDGAAGVSTEPFITAFTSSTQVTVGIPATTTVSGVTVTVDGAPYTSLTGSSRTADGTHPSIYGHKILGANGWAFNNQLPF